MVQISFGEFRSFLNIRDVVIPIRLVSSVRPIICRLDVQAASWVWQTCELLSGKLLWNILCRGCKRFRCWKDWNRPYITLPAKLNSGSIWETASNDHLSNWTNIAHNIKERSNALFTTAQFYTGIMTENSSPDLLWEVIKGFNSYQVKRRSGGGVVFSRDPLNLTNKQTRKHTGLVNPKAIGIIPGEKGGVTLVTKKGDSSNKPGSELQCSSFSSKNGTRKTYHSIVNSTAKRNYRPDLRQSAVARASAIRHSQRTKKETPNPKPRGAKATKNKASEWLHVSFAFIADLRSSMWFRESL